MQGHAARAPTLFLEVNNMKEEILQAFKESAEVKTRFIRGQADILLQVVKVLVAAFKGGHKVLLFGNGGSAADAQHLAAEFVNRFLIERPPLPAIALTTDTSILTSIGNDYGYADTFAKQVKALGKTGDVAIGISTTGTAANVVKALKTAKDLGLKTVAMTGGNGGDLVKLADFALVVDSSSTPRIQETHITIGHVLCEMVDRMLFQQPT